MAYYLSLIFFTVCVSILGQRVSATYIITIFICIAFDWTFRLTEPDFDLAVYEGMMDSSSLSLYFIKESASFLTMRFLFDLLGNANYVFFTIDTILIILTGFVFWSVRFPIYGLPLFFFNFVMIMGHQNVYRQFMAMIFVGLIVVISSHKTRLLLGAMSILSHNPSLVGLLGIFKSKYTLLNSIYILLGITLLLVGSKFETTSATESKNHYIFGILILFFLIAAMRQEKAVIHFLFPYFIVVLIAAALLVVSGTAERIYMYLFVVLLPIVILRNEAVVRPRLAGRLFLVGVSFIPFFSSSGPLLLL